MPVSTSSADSHRDSTRPTLPAFVIGISGNRDPSLSRGRDEELRKHLRSLYRFFKLGTEECKWPLERLSGFSIRQLGLEKWRGVGKETPIILLSSLAPGIDQIAVEVALEEEFRFTIKCPLPYPHQLYAQSSCFKGLLGVSDQELRSQYEGLVSEIGEHNTFHVYRAEDMDTGDGWRRELDPSGLEDLKAKMRAEVETGPSRARRLRYRAAGEYVAAYSDVLIAVSDADEDYPSDSRDDSEAGTHRIIEVKRRGVSPGVLPLSGSFNWADNGPTFHLHHPRRKYVKKRDCKRRGRALRVLYPYDVPKMEGPAPKTEKPTLEERVKATVQSTADLERAVSLPQAWEWAPPMCTGDPPSKYIEEGGSIFCETIKNLSRFCRDFDDCAAWRDPKSADEVKRALGIALDTEPSLQRMPELSRDLIEQQYNTIAVRRLASSGKPNKGKSTPFRDRNDRFFEALIIGAFASAFSYQIFGNWQVAFEDPLQTSEPIQTLFGLLGLVITIGMGGWYLFHKGREIESRVFDYRALAEGLRVQLFWNLAGMGRSVAANYMERQRGEMSWIRSAISSLNFPYERDAERFAAHDDAGQVILFRFVRCFWFQEQKDYFYKKAKSGRTLLKQCHGAGASLAMTGLLLVLFIMMGWHFPDWLPSSEDGLPVSSLLVSGLSLAFLLVSGFLPYARLESSKKRRMSFFQKVTFLMGEALNPDRLSKWTGKDQEAVKEKEGFRIGPLVAHVIVSLCLIAITYSSALIMTRVLPGLQFDTVLLIAMGVSLISGALTLAYSERSLLSEETYRYAAMASMFYSADLRLQDLLESMAAAIASEDSEGIRKARREANDLFFAVGKEALDENAEWLILHRSRPLELVLGS